MSKIELPELPASFCKGSPSLEAIGKTVGGLYSGDVMRAYAEAAVLAEREACVRQINELADSWHKKAAELPSDGRQRLVYHNMAKGAFLCRLEIQTRSHL